MGTEHAGSSIDKASYEKKWANHLARLNLNSSDKVIWNQSSWTIRPFVYYDKILVAWTIVRGEPQVKDILAVTSLDASFQDGVWITLQSKILGGPSQLVTHSPRRLNGLDLFVWVPFFNEMRFHGPEWDNPMSPRNLRLTMCIKMQSDPNHIYQDNRDFISELHVFRERFPQYADTRF